MPVCIPNDLPAFKTLQQENIFLMTADRARTQDIRPLRIAILNLMPAKIVTETQLLRLIGNTPLQVEITLLRMATHITKNTSADHLESFYQTFAEVRNKRFDGLIITGAPVETIPFQEVTYWPELMSIMNWAERHVFSTLYICWAAQAGLYYHYGVKKYPLPKKVSGVYWHTVLDAHSKLTRGFDDAFLAPHSRYTESRTDDIRSISDLQLLAISEDVGVYLAAARNGKQVFVTGHAEYDIDTLRFEYERDIVKGLDVPMPCNYFPDNDVSRQPVGSWRAHANLLFSNWLNYYVYQETPFDLGKM
ncbi:MAG: homoserine O-succinyltransferase [Dehalococcoidia bacterium]|nr:homoserine O-succinyltransferase [Dehalococcoidia bacterium]